METHRFDVISFVFGALFLALTASAMWSVELDWGFDVGAWIFPVVVLIIGVSLLSSGIRNAAMKKKDSDSLT